MISSRADSRYVINASYAAYMLSFATIGLMSIMWTYVATDRVPFSAWHFGGFTVAFLVARAMALRLPQGDRVYLVLVISVVGIALRGAEELILASAAAGILGAVLHLSRFDRDGLSPYVMDVVRSTVLVAALTPFQALLRVDSGFRVAGDPLLLVIIILGIGYAFLDVATLAIGGWALGGEGIIGGITQLVRPLLPVYLVHVAMAAVSVRIYPQLGLWGFAIALLLTFILQNSFNLYLHIRRAYSQTISALAHAAELDRPTDTGHAQRVADLAVSVARHMGMSSLKLERIGYASLLHDIGRIGGEHLEDDDGHPLRGAAIVEKVPFLEGVAPLIAHHRELSASDLSSGAAIVGVCCRFDRLAAEVDVDAALETLKSDEVGARALAVSALQEMLKRSSPLLGASEVIR